MSLDLHIRDHMTKSPITVDRRTTLAEALKIMEERGFRHLPVVDGSKLVGLVSERELRALENMQGFNSAGCTVEDFSLVEPYSVAPNALVRDVAFDMATRKIGSAAVIENGEVVGVFTTIDALRLLVDLLSAK
ncbi:MAG: CBS domain-containing protein [Polyangiaceae bacterium]|nr:CBS domain-containing protein [Polyangiaceae bacterium]